MKFRVGRKAKRTIYLQYGPEPSDDDELVGVVDTGEIASLLVCAVNIELGLLGGTAELGQRAPLQLTAGD